MSTEGQSRGAKAAQHVLPASLALVWLGAALLQRHETPVLGAQIGMITLSVPLTLWALTRKPRGRIQWQLIGVSAAPVVFLLLSSLMSVDPRTALLGAPPVWQGWLVWAALLGWLVLTLIGARRGDLYAVSRTLSLLGGAVALWAIAEWAGILTPYDTEIGGVMALFDNPLSLAQALLVTGSATVAITVLRRNRGLTTRGYAILLALQVLALYATQARAAFLGVAVGLAAYGLTTHGDALRARITRSASVTLILAFCLGFAGILLASTGLLGQGVFARVDALLTDRPGIWVDVAERISPNPLLGAGPSDFNTIVNWSVGDTGSIDMWFTSSEHSLMMSWLLGAGLVGFAVFGVAAATIAISLLRIARAPRSTGSVRALAAGAVAVFVAALFSWPEPLALLGTTVVVGCLLSVNSTREHSPGEDYQPLSWRTGVGLGAAVLLAGYALHAITPDLVTQYRAGTATDARHVRLALRDARTATGDVSYLESELFIANVPGSGAVTDVEAVELVRGLVRDYPATARHRVDVPLLGLEILWNRSANLLSPDEYWALSQALAERGREADADMGVWRYVLARAAFATRRPDAAGYIADARSAGDLPPQAVTLLDEWAATLESSATAQP